MSTVKFDKWENSDGTENYKCRAWVNFNGTGTVAINASGNVTSITDGGVGLYTVNFTNAMPDANYSVSISGRKFDTNDDANFVAAAGNITRVPSASACPITTATFAGAKTDYPNIYVAIFR